MKTATELFNEFATKTDGLIVQYESNFIEALAEHNAEIIKIIDEMIDDSDYRDISQLYHIGKREALTELKAKL